MVGDFLKTSVFECQNWFLANAGKGNARSIAYLLSAKGWAVGRWLGVCLKTSVFVYPNFGYPLR